MAEFDKLMESVKDKSAATQKAYKVQYNKFHKLLDDDIAHASQKKLIAIATDEDMNTNQQQALLNIAILVRRLEKLDVKELETAREKNKKNLQENVKQNNRKIINDLPSLDDLEDFTEHLWEKGQYIDYVINYLLINYQVRNQDLNFELVRLKRNTKDDTKNFIWLSSKGDKATYIRNIYKTANVYGKKTNVITDKKFLLALRRIHGCQKSSLQCGVFIPNENQVGYYIQKATYKNLGEAKYLKIIIDANRGNLQKLKEIAENRGTDVNTLISSYDINNV
tara:strand:- start:136 stop:975 length:840 start_codon:yes stop_codon:yes gene_type:complete